MIGFALNVQTTPLGKLQKPTTSPTVTQYHIYAGYIIISLTFLLIVNGILLRIQRRLYWKLNWVNFNSLFHKIVGYFVIFFAFISLQTGEYIKLSRQPNSNSNYKYFLFKSKLKLVCCVIMARCNFDIFAIRIIAA